MIGTGILDRVYPGLRKLGLDTPPIFVSNSLVLKLHGDRIARSLPGDWSLKRVIPIGDGERFKTQRTLERVYQRLFGFRADRSSWLAAVGGGVVGDLTGFAAATFMRGIPYVNVPTTLLAQVDSAIGGKVGINVRQGKNLIGAIHQPSAVLSDVRLLATLPARELASGLFEVVKYGAIRSEKLLRYLDRRLEEVRRCEPRALEYIVTECSRIKAEIVSSDERESSARMCLNYGHTIGHALEAATDFRRFKHGEAVAWGMIAAVELGAEFGMALGASGQRLRRLISKVAPLPSLRGISPNAVWRALQRDKKRVAGETRFVLLPRMGEAEIHSVDPSQLKKFVRLYLDRNGSI